MKSSFGATLVVRNPPAHTGDMGLIPDLGRSHMLQSNEAHVPQLFSLCSRAQELQLLKPTRPRARTPQQEKPPQREVRALQLESSLLATTGEKPVQQQNPS